MNKKLNSEQQTRKSKNAECEKAVSLRHGLGILSNLTIEELINLNKEIDEILKKKRIQKRLKTRERKLDVFIAALNGVTYVELSKKFNVTPSTIRQDFMFVLSRTSHNNNLQEKLFGNKSFFRITKKEWQLHKKELISNIAF